MSTGNSDDKWCIDPRGIITLYVTKQSYERLGLVGTKLPFKGCPEQYGAHLQFLTSSFTR